MKKIFHAFSAVSLLLIVVTLSAGCQQITPRHSNVPVEPLAEGASELYVFRYREPDELDVPIRILVGENFIGALRPGQFIRLSLETGNQEITFAPLNDLREPKHRSIFIQRVLLESGKRTYMLTRLTSADTPLLDPVSKASVYIAGTPGNDHFRMRFFLLAGEIARGAMASLKEIK